MEISPNQRWYKKMSSGPWSIQNGKRLVAHLLPDPAKLTMPIGCYGATNSRRENPRTEKEGNFVTWGRMDTPQHSAKDQLGCGTCMLGYKPLTLLSPERLLIRHPILQDQQ